MSSNQSNSQSKKMRSIARSLNGHILWRKILLYIGTDLVIFLLCTIVFGIASERMVVKGEMDRYSRELVGSYRSDEEEEQFVNAGFFEGVRRILRDPGKYDGLLVYRVYDGKKVYLELPILYELLVILGAVTVLFLIQLFLCFLRLPFERKYIRRRLRPISKLALKTDELSRLDFDESKYHLLEEKITSLDTAGTLQITPGDKELESIETAINNLLLRIRESNKQQARFVNDASHELRTPIAVIEGYANMLARWGREDEKVLDESITAIQNESKHMKYLVEQLLFLARGDSGKTVLHPERISLAALMRETYEESLMIDEKHVYRFEQEDETDGYELGVDQTLIKQAVRILIDNAVKYTAEHDEIVLGIGREDGVTYLLVQDNGIGMDAVDVEHMFERFYRADKARSFKEGTGLGLSIAKWIVDKHGGHFEIVSRVGLGTRIRIMLPKDTVAE